jgi:hypothetical protein
MNEIKKEERAKKWTWVGIVYRLCNGDIIKSKEVLGLSYITCLVWLSYEKEMQIK